MSYSTQLLKASNELSSRARSLVYVPPEAQEGAYFEIIAEVMNYLDPERKCVPKEPNGVRLSAEYHGTYVECHGPCEVTADPNNEGRFVVFLPDGERLTACRPESVTLLAANA